MSKNPTVFLIDDDVDDQEIFCLALARADSLFECVCENDGIKALEKINADHSFRPDFIFIDLNMPRMNGSQCLAEIKKIDRLKDVPVFIYSTASDPASIIENKKLGAEDFIVKPADINILTRTLLKILKKNYAKLIAMIFFFAFFSSKINAQTHKTDTIQKVNELKKLSVEELTNIEVTSVTKTPQPISEVASAIQVVTGDEIRRSSVTRLPEAFRLASNMQVAQAGSHDWGITARGFNGLPVSNSSLANKLLVLIDGRSVYTPLFGGVFWDVQNVLLEDVNRLEVVSGPGGTAWGANAVNGVVNIITKNAKETQGLFASASLGSFLGDKVALRYGGQIDSNIFYRVYGQHFDFSNTTYSNGIDAGDSWTMNQGGFRMDYYHSAANTFTFQGDVYDGEEDDTAVTDVNGQNLLLKWTHNFSDRSGLHFQYYIDRTFRNSRSSDFRDIMVTNDFEFQHNFYVGERNHIVWGADYKLSHDDFQSSVQQIIPPTKQLLLYSIFVQDQITLVPHKWELTIGSKLLHNNYTDLEFHPTVRIAYTPDAKNTIWAAVSQAVRTPTRIDVEYPATSFGDFKSEKVLAYELGYHTRPFNRVSFSLATFYNNYTDLRSLDTNVTPPPYLYFANHLEAKTYGFELSINYDLTSWWKLKGGYTYLHEEFNNTDPHTLPNSYQLDAIDPNFWFNMQSIMNVGKHFEVDAMVRYVDDLPASFGIPSVDAYFTANLRVAYQYKWCTISLLGKNLIEKYHIESGVREIPRAFVGKIAVNF
jgi:iron complex outermembrane receptor protein